MLGFRWTGFIGGLVLVGVLGRPSSGTDRVDFVQEVSPIFDAYCVGCHTADDPEGGFAMDSPAGLFKGGDSGLAVTPGVASSSRLFLMAAGRMEPAMPPDDLEGPNEAELEVLGRWIDQGATMPEGDPTVGRQLRVPKIQTEPDVVMPWTAVAFSPDQRYQALARFGRVEVHRVNGKYVGRAKESTHWATRDPEVVIHDLPGKVNSIRFDSDGARLLVATGVTGAYGLASLFDLRSTRLPQPELRLVGHRDTLYVAEFSPDGSQIATAGYDRQITLWDASTGDVLRTLTGHHGAIFDLAYSTDGTVLASACADETVKLWNVSTGQRLDTLSQSEGEVLAVEFSPDGESIVTAGRDNRLRVYDFQSKTQVRTNPLLATRFVDSTGLIAMAFIPANPDREDPSESSQLRGIAVLSESGTIKFLSMDDWRPVAEAESVEEFASDLAIAPDGERLLVSLMDGRIVTRPIPEILDENESRSVSLARIYMDPKPLGDVKELEMASYDVSSLLPVKIQGQLTPRSSDDRYTFTAKAGEVWAVDANARDGSPMDPLITIEDETGRAVSRVRLQAVMDSYFTFRGKNSMQVNDFRLFGWQEMRLDDYLYAAGEVTRLWMHPRGPDSGFNVYPGKGNRFTYFGTTHATHALGEPAFIVRPLDRGEKPQANGLPVFDIPYRNDDDPTRKAGKNSRLVFTAPHDGRFTVVIEDARGQARGPYDYELVIRAADPSFDATAEKLKRPLHQGSGREVQLSVHRRDEFDGPVTFRIHDLPEGIQSNFPVTVEAGQTFAVANVWSPVDDSGEPVLARPYVGKTKPRLTAEATIHGRLVRREVGALGDLQVQSRSNVMVSIQPIDPATAEWTESGELKLVVHRGETISARVVLQREAGFDKEVRLGKESAGRNAPHGVIVDNIGLSGLLVLQGQNDREFFLTADPVAATGVRHLHLVTDQGLTSPSVMLEVLP
ncbi:MAG: c-type cytochrome domain-containing protein [Planctomycetota bacterium]